MDAIECGIVKLPRVPVADNIPGGVMPRFRNLWEQIRTDMPKEGRNQAGYLDSLNLPVELRTASEALYGHYRKTFDLMREANIDVPPCFIVVCNNTAATAVGPLPSSRTSMKSNGNSTSCSQRGWGRDSYDGCIQSKVLIKNMLYID